jgi:phenylalanyl-tRNA synthetase beta subunit
MEVLMKTMRPALRGSGFIEIISKGFYSAQEVELLDGLKRGFAERHVALKNSLEASNSHMKATNIIHLTRVLSSSLKHGIVAPKVYDYTRIFSLPQTETSDEPRPAEPLCYNYEHDVLTLASAGRWSDGEWRKGETIDEHARFFTGAIASIIKGLGGIFSVGKSEDPFLHPGMQASVKMGRNVVGTCGVIHPSIREACELREPAFYAEMDLRLLLKFMNKFQGVTVSDFPAISRDMTVSINRKEQAGRVLRLIHEAQVSALNHARIVDDFTKSGEEFRRVTYRIVFQSAERTLRHDEVDTAMAALLENLRDKHGISLADA